MTTSSNADEWGVSHVDLDAYLKRIGRTDLGRARPCESTLRQLHRAHIETIPFENIDIVLRPLKTRWLWLTNRSNLSAGQQRQLVWLSQPSVQLTTARAHRWREDFQGFYDQPADEAQAYLAWRYSHLSTGLLDGTNSLLQAAKARARGYRNKQYMIAIVYLIAAKLPRPSPSVAHSN